MSDLFPPSIFFLRNRKWLVRHNHSCGSVLVWFGCLYRCQPLFLISNKLCVWIQTWTMMRRGKFAIISFPNDIGLPTLHLLNRSTKLVVRLVCVSVAFHFIFMDSQRGSWSGIFVLIFTPHCHPSLFYLISYCSVTCVNRNLSCYGRRILNLPFY